MRPRASRLLVMACPVLMLWLAACSASPGVSPAAGAPAAGPTTELIIPSLPGPPQPQMAEAAPEDEPEDEGEEPPFAGTWISELDGSLLEMTRTTFHLRFPYEEGMRDNYARILSYDTKRGRVVLKYTRILQDGEEQPVGDDTDYMIYRIDGDILQKYVAEDDFADDVGDERFRRSRGGHDVRGGVE